MKNFSTVAVAIFRRLLISEVAEELIGFSPIIKTKLFIKKRWGWETGCLLEAKAKKVICLMEMK